MSWSKSASNDVVGYRVYDVTLGSRTLVSSIRSSGGRSIAVPDGSSYLVVAVDITGLESAVSNIVTKESQMPIEPTPPHDGSNGGEPDYNNPGNSGGNGNGSESNDSDVNGDSGDGNIPEQPPAVE